MEPNLRSLLLQEWRGLPQEETDFSTIKTVEEILPSLLKSLGVSSRLEESEVRSAWREIVGEFLGAHSEPTGLKNGVLFVRVHQPSVRFELQTAWKTKILEALRRRFEGTSIREIRFIS